jgi:SAM domain (Sterile alpha motif)
VRVMLIVIKSNLEIAKILGKMGYEKHIDSFVQNEIDYPMFLNLEDSDLKDIGIKALGSRKKILAAIQILRSEVEVAPVSAAVRPKTTMAQAVGMSTKAK